MRRLSSVVGLLCAGVAVLAWNPVGECDDPAATPHARLQAILKEDLSVAPPDEPAPEINNLGREVRAHRAIRVLETVPAGPGLRGAAVWFIDVYPQQLPYREYSSAAGTAVLRLAELAERDRPTPQERLTLQTAGRRRGDVAGLVQAALLDDDLRGHSDEEKVRAYEEQLRNHPVALMHAFLLLHRMRVPAALRYHWEWGPRHEKTRRPSYEGWALDHYFRFRSMTFPNVEAEMQFLWGRILGHYESLAQTPRLSDDDAQLQRREEPRAAVARLIDLGDPVVPFLLARRDFILRAADPLDIRARDGNNYELTVMMGLCRREFLPILEELARSRVPVVRSAAERVGQSILNDDPYPVKAWFVYELRPPLAG